jgi:ABC-type nickel/cobalt efflux system permease component RcnA
LIAVTVTNTPSTPFWKKDEADEALKEKPAKQWKSGDEERLRTAAATFAVVVIPPKDEARPESPGQVSEAQGIFKPAPCEDKETRVAVVTAPDREDEAAVAKPSPETASKPAKSWQSPLLKLLDSPHGLWLLLLLAAGFGAIHALTPGHGKTLVAAYLVGERGTIWHALLLGLTTTLTHTGTVIAVAIALVLFFPKTPPEKVQTALKLGGGLLVAGLGIWLLLRRLSGQADHFHLPGHGHHHHHGHDHHHAADHYHDEHGNVRPLAARSQAVSWGGLIGMGISGGIVPCWDAIFLLGFALITQRLWLGVPLLLAFSVGLAGVLVLIGILVVCAKGLVAYGWGESRLVRALPVVSAILITLLGLWLCYDSIQARSEPPPPLTQAQP